MTWQRMGSSRYVLALTAFNNELIAGDARWNGSDWQPLGGGMNGFVYALAVFNNELIAGGDFAIAGGVSANRIARWDGGHQRPCRRGGT
jgi:hypothetical protein